MTGKTESIVFSVKAGHVTVAHLRDLRGVLDREGAAMGALVCMESPTRPMRAGAASAGFIQTAWGSYPRLQIRSIAELLAGQNLDAPNAIDVTYAKAPKVTPIPRETQPSFELEPDKLRPVAAKAKLPLGFREVKRKPRRGA